MIRESALLVSVAMRVVVLKPEFYLTNFGVWNSMPTPFGDVRKDGWFIAPGSFGY
jgi:hypothetical protein